MQPYFFPYLGYFSLIKHTDRFILFDAVQFIKQGWIERNRILKPENGWQYISVPLMKHSRDIKIKDVRISNNFEWQDRLLRQLEHYKKSAPYYAETMAVVQSSLCFDADTITFLDKHILENVCEYLKIKARFDVLSEMRLDYEEPKAADEWPISICNALGGVDEYWNPEGGLAFFDRKKFGPDTVDIHFMKMNLQPYFQKCSEFESSLSIIDVMMFNSPEKISSMLDAFDLL
jgi:hypothetical protein